MATSNSKPVSFHFVVAFCLFVSIAGVSAEPDKFAARAETEFNRAQRQFEANPENSTNAWQFARASFDFAEFAQSKKERAMLARQGITACQQLLARDSNSAPAHYYLGMNSGQLARTEFIGALRLVKEMEHEFETAADLDEHFDFAGPERNLGLLYREAPSIGSIGSRKKAREWLERAVELAPDYPENHLNLLESFLKWNDSADAQHEIKALYELWPRAQKKFSGEKWERNWVNWKKRRDVAQDRLDEMLKPLQPPHHND